MGGGNGAKSKRDREKKAAKEGSGVAKSQLKVNEQAKDIQCVTCKNFSNTHKTSTAKQWKTVFQISENRLGTEGLTNEWRHDTDAGWWQIVALKGVNGTKR
ncbi:hypothetical protein GLAREA_08514 [Glarea lozoyensis ATCC 20868]|uniref:Small EDRK-rich factor-like N-terminal domain-containing protein n=1 Tax=Glarea lozoyensis (strain ATCC 20868 / MF5171) TaxID=1116229 RepID=S3CXU8_GLAL2|nr:uncharacterized protein GLAREA_08514 [Glarea lozoyensis ATCC 20868]EPE24661.1 hypothetical protein GLAREA_08514 [Glarea lozoyensis ATCC 20868]